MHQMLIILLLAGVTTPTASATAAPTSTSAGTSATTSTSTSTASDRPWYTLYEGRRVGVGLEAGAPTGANLVALFRPWWWLRANAGLAYDIMGFGLKGGVSVTPWQWSVRPTFSLDFGHFFDGDANRFFSASTPNERKVLEQAAYDFVSVQAGVELGSQERFSFYARAGFTYIGNMSLSGKDVAAIGNDNQGTSGGTFGANSDFAFRALVPSLTLGVNFFLF